MSTTTMTRMAALGRAEATLLWRNRSAAFTALAMPLVMIYAMHATTAKMGVGRVGMTATAVSVTGGIGMILAFAVYANLVPAYVTRRDELVLKRLRTGEPTDLEILAGTALPSVVVALAQCAVLVVAGTAMLDLSAPRRPEVLLLGVVLGIPLMVACAAATTIVTRSAEVAQLTTMPLWLVSLAGSGLFIPLEIMPHQLADVCRLLPMTPVVDLFRAGFLGGAGAMRVVRDVLTAGVWLGLAGWSVRRWFRWEPRR
ncbi:ABC transporter permease [Streptomyces sp. RPT161]|uniref:ABC transporter permease n=1 Tax=Streptomyces sp. RPT161 TaxID=3015993 RepID=UPI0022B9256A|nr:ABC transporter permease [Streptomyces sp. RPT161]